MSREQELINICFSLVAKATDDEYIEAFRNMELTQKMKWVADNLKACGFNTRPIGMSWGVLVPVD